MLTTVVFIKDVTQQYDGLMTCMGLQLNGVQVKMFVLHHEIASVDEAYHDNMVFFEELGGERFSNNQENIDNYGFKHATIKEVVAFMKESDHVIFF